MFFTNHYSARHDGKRESTFRRADHCLADLKKLHKKQPKRILVLDFEAYEYAQHKVTEVGIAIWVNGEIEDVQHIIIQENQRFRNGKFVCDNRDNFSFGKSLTLRKHQAASLLRTLIDQSDCVASYGLDDRKYLERLDVIAMTQWIDICLWNHGLSINSNRNSLERSLQDNELGGIVYPHNAGNDAEGAARLLQVILQADLMEIKNNLNEQRRKFM